MSVCPQCDTRFDCGVVDNHAPATCWCMALPRTPIVAPESASSSMSDKSCLCQACLLARKAMTGKE